MEHYEAFIADSARWEGFRHRPGDIVISTPSKSGTTWLQQLVALLVFRGEPPAPVATLSPWVDMRIRSREELEAILDAQQHRRFVKTHVPLDGLPLDEQVSYVVVGRDPRDAWLSMVDHIGNLDRERVVELVGEPPAVTGDERERPDPGEDPDGAFRAEIWWERGRRHTAVHPAHVLHHLRTGWDRRTTDNVHLFHYADLVKDLSGELAQLAEALGIDAGEEELEEYADRAGLSAMRAAAADLAPDAHLGTWQDPAAFFNSARMGEWRRVFSKETLAAYEARVLELHADEEFLAWVHGGRTGGEWRAR